MAKVNIKYKCGDEVIIRHKPPTEGIVTAVFIRGRGRAYEVSYASADGPTSSVCAEVEIQADKSVRDFGFSKK